MAIICRRLRKTIESDPFMRKNVSTEGTGADEGGALDYVSGAAAGGVRTRGRDPQQYQNLCFADKRI